MPELVRLYRVFISAPSDITAEHAVIAEILSDWNRQHGPRQKSRLESVDWRTHTFPAAGDRPQALINRQAFDQSDLVVAIFWGRFGSPTGKFDSGTEEEIHRAVRQNKPVLVYFSDQPIPGRRAAAARKHHAKIEKFRRRFSSQAIYFSYSDMPAFERAFRNHLALAMNDLLAKAAAT